MKTILSSICLFFSIITATFGADQQLQWVADYEVAIKQAAEQKRRIFVLFTNSKSCVPCRMLKEQILSKPEFIHYAANNLVLLEIDYAPYLDKKNKKELSEIEGEKKVPKELWMNGRGPWPYLFVFSPSNKQLYSGKALDATRNNVADYLKFLEGLP